jgi:release factor glutamine methyltransferase
MAEPPTNPPRAPSASAPWTIGRVLAWAAGDLRQRGSPSPRLDAELMLASVVGGDRVRLIVDADRPLRPEELGRYRELHKRRRRGEPVAYLRGVREFYGRAFRVDHRVLVPRPETERLVEVALERTRAIDLSARVLDVCTGSGCVAITLAKERPTTTVVAADASAAALEVARRNAIELGAPIGLLCSDLFESLERWRASFDLVTANPPYIADDDWNALPVDVRQFEPRLALAGGPDGLDLVRRLVADAPAMLGPRGVLAIEVGAGQAERVAPLFAAAGFVDVAFGRDYGGHLRIVSGRQP